MTEFESLPMLLDPNRKFEYFDASDDGDGRSMHTDIGVDRAVWDANSAAINARLVPRDEFEPPETTRDRIIKGFRIGDPNMPFTYEIADVLRVVNRRIGLNGKTIPRPLRTRASNKSYL